MKQIYFLALVFTAVLVVLVPPFQVPDENSHFYRSYHLSMGELMGERSDDQRLGGKLPVSLRRFAMDFLPIREDPQQKIELRTLRSAWRQPLKHEHQVFTDFANVGYYAPFPYLAAAAAMLPLRWFDAPPIALLYAARASHLALYFGLAALALRWLPYRRELFAFLLFLPSGLFIAAGVSGDVFTNGLSFLFLALCLRLLDDPDYRRSRYFVVLAASLLVITLSKPVYALLVGVVWLIWNRDRQRTSRSWSIGISVAVVMTLVVWSMVAGNGFIPYDQYHPEHRLGQQLNPGVAPDAQLRFVIANPLSYAKTTVISFAESAPATMAHYFGKFGWEKNYLPTWSLLGLALTSLLLAMTHSSGDQFANRQLNITERLWFALTGVLMTVGVATVIYLQWNPVGNDRIWSLSGRYFIPVFPLFFLAMPPSYRWLLPFPPRRMAIWVLATIYLVALHAVTIRYYGGLEF